MQITRANISSLHEELDAVLKAFADKHGLVASKTRLRFTATNFEFVGMRASKAVCKNLGDGKPYLWDATFIASQIKMARAAKA